MHVALFVISLRSKIKEDEKKNNGRELIKEEAGIKMEMRTSGPTA